MRTGHTTLQTVAGGRWTRWQNKAEMVALCLCDNPVYFVDPDGIMWPWPSWGTVKALANAVSTKISDSYHSSKLARDIPRAYENTGIKKAVDWTRSKVTTAKPDKPDKVKTKGGTSFTAEGGKSEAMATPEGDRSVKPVDMTTFMIFAMDVFGPETTMPGAAPDGSNPFQTNNGGGATSESTMSKANAGDEETIDAKIQEVFVVDELGGGWAAPAQKLVKDKDTVIKKKDLYKIPIINRNRNIKADEELQKKQSSGGN